jgi:hypothetical protein
MRKRRILLVLAILSLLLVWPAVLVRAECASPPSLEAALEDAPGAFIGEVSEARFDSDQATIRVLWIWKGRDLPEEIVVQTPIEVTSSGESSFRFRGGATYVVLMQDDVAPFTVDECSGTRIYRADGEAIPSDLQVAAGAAMGHRPGDTNAGVSGNAKGAGYWPLVVLVTGLAGLVAIGSYRLRRRSVAIKGGRHRVRRLGGFSSRGRSGGSQLGRLRSRRKG